MIRLYLNNQELKNCGKAGDILGQVEAVFQKREKQDKKGQNVHKYAKNKIFLSFLKKAISAILWD